MQRSLGPSLLLSLLYLVTAVAAGGRPDLGVRELIDRGALLERRGDLDDALNSYQEASRILDETFDRSDPLRLTNLNNIARVYLLLDQPTDAAHIYQAVLASAEGESRKTIPLAIAEYNSSAILINANKRLQGLDLFKTSIADWKCLLESVQTRLEAARELDGLLHLVRSLDLYRMVEPIYQMRLTTLESALGGLSADVARALIDLGIVNKDLGEAPKAESFYSRANDISRRLPLGQNQDLATGFTNLAELLREQGRARECFAVYQEIIKHLRSINGPPGFYLALALHGLGVALCDQREYARAVPNLQEAVDIWRKLRQDAPLAQGLRDLGVAFSENRQFEEAERCFNRSIGVTIGRLGTRSVALVPMYGSLGVCYCRWGDYVSAEQAFLTARDIAPGAAAEAQPSGIETVDLEAAACLYEQGRYSEAEVKLQDALRESPDPQTPAQLEDYANTLYLMGMVCSAEEKLTPAERFQKRSLRIREQLFGSESPKLVQNLQNLSWIYASTRRDEEAKRANERILRLRGGGSSYDSSGARLSH